MFSDIRKGQMGLKAVGTSRNVIPYSVLFVGFIAAYSGTAYAQSTPTPAAKPADDATNQSARERDRILLKRNPIASEYQGNDTPGVFFGAVSDAEGVDFRGLFRVPKGKANTQLAEIEANASYQDVAKAYKPGGSLKLAKS